MSAVISARGRVRLKSRDEMPILDKNKQLNRDWVDKLIAAKCAWLWVQNLVIVFKVNGVGDFSNKKESKSGAGELLSYFDGNFDSLKNLAYQLYNICEQKNLAREAMGYNDLVTDWQTILSESVNYNRPKLVLGTLFEQEAAT